MNAVIRDYRPDPAGSLTPRLLAMAEAMRELAFSPEGASERALIGRGFSTAEILEYAVEAAALASSSSQADAARFDRVPDILSKAIAGMPHRPPRVGGHELDGDGLDRWAAFCVSRAAFRLDPWEMQSERALQRLNDALRRLPLIDPERARIVAGLGAEQRATLMRRRR